MAVGMRLFAEQGFEATTVREIAAAAKVNLALINYHFDSKDGLLREIMEQRAQLMQERIREIAADTGIDEAAKISLIITQYVEKILTHHTFYKVLLQELFMKNRNHLRDNTLDLFAGNARSFEAIIRKGIRKGIFRKVDAALCYPTMMGTLQHLVLSTRLRIKLFSRDGHTDPVEAKSFKKRVHKHIYQLIVENILLKN